MMTTVHGKSNPSVFVCADFRAKRNDWKRHAYRRVEQKDTISLINLISKLVSSSHVFFR